MQLKAFVRDGYEWARRPWLVARIGMGGNGQGCAIPRMIGLAIKLSDAGVGDYWEDVDLYIRNHGTEMQFTPEDIPYLRSLNENKLSPDQIAGLPGFPHGVATTEDVFDASMGAFAADQFKSYWALCCSPWGAMGMFYAWEGTLRYADGTARINLLLNRASPCMDVDSYLPYEGKVVLRNKTAREVLVRIPLWIDKKAVGCRLGSKTKSPEWIGNYLRIQGLKAGDVVTIEFPVAERTERWTTDETIVAFLPGWPGKVTRNFRFRGNTLVEITPPVPTWPLNKGNWWLYQDRARKYRASKASMIEVTRFTTPLSLRW